MLDVSLYKIDHFENSLMDTHASKHFHHAYFHEQKYASNKLRNMPLFKLREKSTYAQEHCPQENLSHEVIKMNRF